MALPLPTFTVEIITFFGACPTTWATLSRDQKDLCIGQIQLTRQIEGRYAWPPEGELARQWNDTGYEEYSAVISHKYQLSIGNLGNIVKRQRGRDKPVSHRLVLLSTSPSRDTATPFVVVSSKSEKVIRDTINLFKSHQRLCNFGIEYMEDRGGLKLAAGEPDGQSMSTWQDTRTSGKTYPYFSGLSGARIAVYRYSGDVRGQKRNVATLGGVFLIGGRHFALTAAHVFFDNVESTGSWADSGLYIIADGSNSFSETPPPKVSGIYEVVIENGWPQMGGVGDDRWSSKGTSIGLVTASVLQHRKNPAVKALPEVIWDAELDWALIELKDPALWEPSKLHLSPEVSMSLKPPSQDQAPPSGRLLLAAGVSGTVTAVGLKTVGGIMLPWSQHVIKAWVLECEIAVGDCGSVAISLDTGTVYGMVVAHDPNTIMTYVVPAMSVFRTIIERCGHRSLSLDDIFSVTGREFDTSNFTEKAVDENASAKNEAIKANERGFLPRSVRPISGDNDILQAFISTVEAYTLTSQEGKPYIRTEALLRWLRSESGAKTSHIDLLLDYAYSKYKMVPVDSDQISKNGDPCLYVFSVLLELGHGDLIDRFQRLGLTDRSLPFDHPRLQHVLTGIELPDSSTLAKDFFDKQWAYSPLIFALDMGRDLPVQTVIPILRKHQINSKGGTATLWQIEVLEDFVDHRLRQVAASAKSNDSKDTLGYYYSFALKSYQSGSQGLFRNELDALRALRENSGMVRCLGDYSQAEVTWHREDVNSDSESAMTRMTHNILLEYGELDLDEFFFDLSPPILSEEISLFWENLSVIAHAIAGIHQFEIPRGGMQQVYHGWHSDIKPDNILLVGGRFKLADPGFARFEKSDRSETLLLGGTITYGAPECDRTQHTRAPVGQAIDIWSFGCVLSVAATWVILGYGGVQQFNGVRKAAIMKKDNRQGAPSASFSDGREVLQEVRNWHAYLRKVTRMTDKTSGHILDLIDDRMLIGAPAKRISARELCTRLKVILSRSKDELDDKLPEEILNMLLKLEEDTSDKSGFENFLDRRSTRRRVPAMSVILPHLQETPLHSKNLRSVFATDDGRSITAPHRPDNAVSFIVPFARNPNFTGRESQLDELEEKLFIRRQSTRYAVTGLGGIGKTQLVLELVYRIRDRHKNCSVIWIPATNMESLHQAYLDTAKRLNIPGWEDEKTNVKRLVQDYLSKESTGQWLLVFDNADDIDMWIGKYGSEAESSRLIEYLPRSEQGYIIFTSRDRKTAVKLAHHNIIEMPEMNEEAATQLLQNCLINPDLVNNWLDAKALLEELAYLPLAIIQAVAFINENGIALADYRSFLAEQEEDVIDLLSEEYEDIGRYQNIKNPVATTWLISFQQIRHRNPLAADYLSFMACIDPKDIPQSLLPAGTSRKKEIEAIGILEAYSFIIKRPANLSLDLHRLVHLAIRNWLRKEKLIAQWTERAITRLEEVFPTNDHTNRSVWRIYLPHVQYVLKSEIVDKDKANRIALARRFGMCLYSDGHYKKAEDLEVQVMETSLRVLGQEHPDTLTSISNLASIYRNQGRWKEAEDLEVQVMKTSLRVLGQEHPDTLTSISNLASTYRNQGRWKEAEGLDMQVMETSERVLGQEHPDTLTSVSNLAQVLQSQGKYEQAEQMNQQALIGRETTLGREHPDTLTSVSNLAQVLQSQGKYEQAEQMNQQALIGRETALGREHPDTLTSVSNLAQVLQSQGKYEQAEQMNRRALIGRETTLGREHPDTLTSVSNLVQVLQSQGKYEQAEQMNRRALIGRETTLGREHPDTLTSVSNLAQVLQSQGKYEQAEQMNQQVLIGRETALGREHPDTLTSVSNLAQVLQLQGKYKQAEQMNRRALIGRETVLGREHPDTLTSVYCLAYLLHQQGEYHEASVLYKTATAGYEKSLGPDHPTTKACLKHYLLMQQPPYPSP